MRGLFLVLMLCVLTMPFFAASDSVCCGHVSMSEETKSQHHQPMHLPQPTGADDQSTADLGLDLDCGVCHANCAAAATTVATVSANPVGMERFEYQGEVRSPHWHERPYRPNWFAPQRSGLNLAA